MRTSHARTVIRRIVPGEQGQEEVRLLLNHEIWSGRANHLQRKLSDLVGRHRVQILQGTLDNRGKAMRLSCSGDTYGPFTIPRPPERPMPNVAWRLGLSMRLLEKLHHNHGDLKCPKCSKALPDAYGDHLISCGHQGLRERTILWHDAVENEEHQCLQACQTPHTRQPSNQFPGSNLRPDIVVEREHDQLFLDVRTVLPAAASYVAQAADAAGAAAERAAQEKIGKYSTLCAADETVFSLL